MRRIAACIVILVLGLPAFPSGGGATAPADRGPLAAPDHVRDLLFDHLSDLNLSNIGVTKKGDAMLNMSGSLLQNAEMVTDAGGSQNSEDIAANSSDIFIFTWEDSDYHIHARMMNVLGNKVGSDIPVCTVSGSQIRPRIAVAPDDEFIITWEDYRDVQSAIYAQRFDAAGNKIGDEIQVYKSATNSAEFPVIATDSTGGFTIAWQQYVSGELDIWAQRFAQNGTKLGDFVSVTAANGYQMYPAIAINSNNEVIVAWEDGRSGPNIYVQRLDSQLNKLGNEILVFNNADEKFWPAIAVNSRDDFIVVWEEYIWDSANSTLFDQVFERRFNATGEIGYDRIAVGNAIPHYNGISEFPEIAVDCLDDCMITWGIYANYTFETHAQELDADGGSLGSDILVPTQMYTNYPARVAVDPSGDWMFAWTDLAGGKIHVYAAPCIHYHCSLGTIVTGDLSAPDFWAWKDIDASYTLENAIFNQLVFDYSIDDGATWLPLVPDWSLAAAGAAPSLRVKVTFSTSNDKYSPVLHNFTVEALADRLPEVSLPADFPAFRNQLVNISAQAVDTDNDTLSFSWNRTGGPPAFLTGNGTPNVSFSPNRSGVYGFRLAVGDGYNETAAYINVTVANRVPAVNPAPQLSAWKFDQVVLSANASDPDGDNLTIRWSQVAGNYSYITNETGADISFRAVKPGLFTFRVLANDGENESLPALINLSVWSRPPIANLSVNASTALVGAPVLFNATMSSDPDGNITGYDFRFGDGNETNWTSSGTAEYSYLAPGNFSAIVTVRDEDGNESTSAPVTVSVTTTLPVIPVPRILIMSPTANEIINSGNLTVTFRVENFTVSAGGGHIRFQLDGGAETSWYSLDPYQLANLSEGQHVLRAFLVNGSDVRLANPEASAEVEFTVRPPGTGGFPDLTLTASDLSVMPARPRAGDTVTFSVTVYNIGDADAKSFSVEFRVDGNSIGEKSVVTLGKGANILREIAWKARFGAHNLSVVVDPENAIDEQSKTNNEASLNFTVEKAAPSSKTAEVPWAMIAAVVIIMLVAAAVAIILMRRKRPVTVIPYQPPPARPAPPTAGAAPAPPPPVKPPETSGP